MGGRDYKVKKQIKFLDMHANFLGAFLVFICKAHEECKSLAILDKYCNITTQCMH